MEPPIARSAGGGGCWGGAEGLGSPGLEAVAIECGCGAAVLRVKKYSYVEVALKASSWLSKQLVVSGASGTRAASTEEAAGAGCSPGVCVGYRG